MKLYTPKANLIDDLLSYGEVEVAKRLRDYTEMDLEPIYNRAGDYALISEVPSGAGMICAKAFALAAVEIVEGYPRQLIRKRRVLKAVPELRKQL